MFNEEKVGENEDFIFYKNEFSETKVKDYKIVIAENKETKYREYLLLKKGNPIYSSQYIEQIWWRLWAYNLK